MPAVRRDSTEAGYASALANGRDEEKERLFWESLK
jgi:hypothetical protein